MKRKGQRRYRVTYATMNASTGRHNDPKVWLNTQDEDEAEYTAQILNMLPNVAGSYVYDRDLQSVIVNYGEKVDHA